jgi:hypothetical protein
MNSFLEHVDTVPPYVARRVAGKGDRWIPAEEIAKSSGLSVPTVMRYARMQSWAGIPLARAQAFALACGHDLLRPNKTMKYLSRTAGKKKPFAHLPTHAQKNFNKLLKRYG